MSAHPPKRSPSLAHGVVALAAFACLLIAWRELAHAWPDQSTPSQNATVCTVPIAVLHSDDMQLLGCGTAPEFAGCGTLQSGDQVHVVNGHCTVEKNAMPGRMRLLIGLELDLNRASADELEQLDGIGRRTAEAIVTYRQQHERFETLDELRSVHGIGERTLQRLRPFLMIR